LKSGWCGLLLRCSVRGRLDFWGGSVDGDAVGEASFVLFRDKRLGYGDGPLDRVDNFGCGSETREICTVDGGRMSAAGSFAGEV
jgi:hypothetical protein